MKLRLTRVNKLDDRQAIAVGNRIVQSTPLISLIDQAIATLDRDKILGIADNISKAIVPHTPCQNGCSHCCYMNVAITEFEANLIADYARRPIINFPDPKIYMETFREDEFATVPCTFLIEGKCSIYPVRPLACRLHHNLAQDESNCIIKPMLENMEPTPSLNLNEISFWFVNLALRNNEAIGDIRHFFPREA